MLIWFVLSLRGERDTANAAIATIRAEGALTAEAQATEVQKQIELLAAGQTEPTQTAIAETVIAAQAIIATQDAKLQETRIAVIEAGKPTEPAPTHTPTPESIDVFLTGMAESTSEVAEATATEATATAEAGVTATAEANAMVTPIPVRDAPVLIRPYPGAVEYRRLDLEWDWSGVLGPDDYFRVEVWNRYNVFFEFDDTVPPIDVAWVKDNSYFLDPVVGEGYDRAFKWRITVVRGEPVTQKQWSTTEHPSWDPPPEFELISKPSEMRTVYLDF
jgi:hypothetical protein